MMSVGDIMSTVGVFSTPGGYHEISYLESLELLSMPSEVLLNILTFFL